jgi:hypothetical protein
VDLEGWACLGWIVFRWSHHRSFTEDESGTFVDAIEQIGKQVADGLEDRLSDFGSQDQNREDELHQQATDDDSHRKAASVGAERPSDANHYA